MKIAAVTIALNEEQFVERWYESAKDADYLLIADTGSQDGTLKKAKKLGVKTASISIKPWRFDDARNAALALIPDDIDYVINLDMDEVLVDGWREHLEKATTTRPRYKYTWSWADPEETIPGLQYNGDKIVKRHGYRWKHPVHEVMTTDRIEETQEFIGLEIHHHPDNSKPRSQYFPLLEVAAKESPEDDRTAFYLGREYFFYQRYEEAAAELKRHLSLPKAVWPPERAASMRYLAKCEPENALDWLARAAREAPGRREALVETAQIFYNLQDFQNCYWAALDAIKIEEKPLDYLCEEFAWNELPYDLAAISAYKLGFKEEAIKYGERAVELNPNDARLASNLTWYKANLK
jgi:glycosyltransferase involved in cell wall biosynthesis